MFERVILFQVALSRHDVMPFRRGEFGNSGLHRNLRSDKRNKKEIRMKYGGWILSLCLVLLSTENRADDTAAISAVKSENAATIGNASGTQGVKPKSPVEAIATLKVKPGYHVELVASEPLIQSPVAISFGPDGRLWVAEMWDYPAGASGRYEPGGRVRCLYDDDGNGRYDRSEVFVEGIPFPTGLTVWNKGLLICAAPDILYAEDTDGDGKADVVRKLFSGFSTHNFHSRVNSLEYGLDDWVYGACGAFGLKITSHVAKTEFALGRRDFRMNPETGAFEAVSGTTQQGRVRNDWDDWFGCSNLVLLQHYPLNDHYLKRNPFIKPPAAIVGISAGPDPGRLFSIADQVRFKLSGPPNRPTAVCGIGVYRDELLGKEYTGNVFSCESVNNLVHRQILTPSGVTFTGHRGEHEKDCEFLASTDAWFRPVQARTGPDGGLWIVDMYRYVIEHPIWIPPETLATLDTRAGSEMGRIYRIVPNDIPRRAVPRLDQLDTQQLVAALDSPNGTLRDLVQQTLKWRNDRQAIPLLEQLATQSVLAEVRLQALCTWAVLAQPSDLALLQALKDPHPGVRRHAVRLSEARLNANFDLAQAVARLTSDDEILVRMQVAYTLGAWHRPEVAEALADLLVRDVENLYLRAACQSSFTPSNVVAVLDSLQHRPGDEVSFGLLDQVFSQAASVADPGAVEVLLSSLGQKVTESSSAESLQRLATFLEALSRRGQSNLDLQSTSARRGWQPAMDRAMVVARDESLELPGRLAAVQLLGQGPTLGQNHVVFLISLLTPRSPAELQMTIVTALGRYDDPAIAYSLLSEWPALSPVVRKEVIPLLMSRTAWTRLMLVALEERTLTSADFNLLQQQALLNHSDEAIRFRAEQSFRSASKSTRQEVIDRYVAGVNEQGDVAKGKQVFQKHCTACHRVHDTGNLVGPDIVSYSSKSVQALLIAVFDPNQAVEPRYQSYSVSLQDGRTAIGQISEESTAGITLLMPEGKKQSILRSEIAEMRNTGKSLMPEGFEKQVTTDDVSDLWAYVRTWRVSPKQLTGNQPDLVEITNSRWVPLRAVQAEIFGRDINFNVPFQSVTSWNNKDDFVRWRIKSPKIMEFDVWCEWASAPETAGNPFRLEVEDMVLTGEILSTGTDDTYQFQKIGMIRIREGESEVVLRPGDSLQKQFANVRGVHLVSRGGVPEAAGRVEFPARKEEANPAAEIAQILLDDRIPKADREKKITESVNVVAKAIPMMVKGLPDAAGSPEEYRRIPWIWRVSITVAKTKDADRIREILTTSLPTGDQRLEHWQAVVIGGGIINGISLGGEYPLPVILKLIGDDRELHRRWQRSLDLALEMSDDEKVPNGTRYDALRMCGMLGWNRGTPVLVKYLPASVDQELQQGAIGGLQDIADDAVATTLVSNLSNFAEKNRRLAVGALMRDEQRCRVLLNAVAEKKITAADLGPERIEKLLKHPSEKIRQEATRLLTP